MKQDVNRVPVTGNCCDAECYWMVSDMVYFAADVRGEVTKRMWLHENVRIGTEKTQEDK